MSKKEFQVEKNSLRVIIVGGGKVGSTLVARLCAEGHEVVVIDTDSAVVQTLCDMHDVLGIVGNGSSYKVQLEAGIDTADLMIAVTASDELNMLCGTVANKMGHCAAIARVRNPDYSDELFYLRDTLGLSMVINPELEAANEIARLLRFPAALSINSFAKRQIEMITFLLPEGNTLVGKALSYLQQKDQVLICAVDRDGTLVIPDGNFVLEAGDKVSVVSTVKNAHAFFKKIGLKTHRVHSAMIIGGGKTSYYLAKQLLDMNIEVRIIEQDLARCEELSLLLDNAVIIHGDGADETLLIREGLEQMESFIPLTGMDEENILLTLRAKRNPDTKVITKINRIAFDSVIGSLELGSVIYPKYIIAETIIAYVRAKQNSIGSNIETLYHIFDDRAEAVEFKVEKDAPVVGIPLKDLRLKRNLLIASILRGDKVIIPNGDDKILQGDRVIVVTMETGFRDITDILRS